MTVYEKDREELLRDSSDTVKELLSRRSVRVFEKKPVPDDVKRAILLSAAEAPSAGCQQLYTIIDVTDQSIKDTLAVTCDDQPFIAEAPLVLVFCADCRKWYDAFREAGCDPRKPGMGDLLLAVTDTAIAAQNAVTAAWSLGVGSCYIGDILEQYEKHRELLNLPEYTIPAVMVVFGYPTEGQRMRKKPLRVDMEYLVAENRYPERTGEDYRRMFDDRRGMQSYDEWMEKFCNRKYNSDFSEEMTRSCEKYAEQYKK